MLMKFRMPRILLLISYILSFALGQKIELKISNYCDAAIDIFWINTAKLNADLHYDNDSNYPEESLFKMTASGPIPANSEVIYQSYDGHQFLARLDNHKDGEPQVMFTKGPKAEIFQIICNSDNSELKAIIDSERSLKPKRKSRHSSTDLPSILKSSSKSCSEGSMKGTRFEKCMESEMFHDFKIYNKQSKSFDIMFTKVSDHYRNYTCRNTSKETTTAIDSYTHVGLDNKVYNISILLNHSHAKIWLVEDMVSDEECEILMTDGRPKLTRATTAGADGTGEVNEVRKAQQASYHFKKDGTDVLWPLYTKVLALANHHTGYDLHIQGQEPFVNIQYNPTDEYRPHCDANCDGFEHKSGGRVATAVLYCQLPQEGGATFFTRADMFVKPKKGAITFFSYWGPDNMMDPEALTEHSGCPVTKGEKWIATFWMREGVTAERPHSMYDPRGNALAM